MPMLLEDLAEETSASNRWAADRLDAEARDLHELRQAAAPLEEVRQRVIDSARQASDYAQSRLPQAEAGWRLALAVLRKQPTGAEADRLLRTFLDVFESGQRLVRSARALGEIARQEGAKPERLDDLDRAEERFQTLAGDAKAALAHRADTWQPADPTRLAQGLQLAREGKTVRADEARTRFRRTRG